MCSMNPSSSTFRALGWNAPGNSSKVDYGHYHNQLARLLYHDWGRGGMHGAIGRFSRDMSLGDPSAIYAQDL